MNHKQIECEIDKYLDAQRVDILVDWRVEIEFENAVARHRVLGPVVFFVVVGKAVLDDDDTVVVTDRRVVLVSHFQLSGQNESITIYTRTVIHQYRHNLQMPCT